MRTSLLAILSLLLGALPDATTSTALACLPEDSMRAIAVTFTDGEVVDLERVHAMGDLNRDYRIEESEEGEFVVYRAAVEQTVMVKIGQHTSGVTSVSLVLPADADIDAIDIGRLLQAEISWLTYERVITGLDSELDVHLLEPGRRYFTGEGVSAGLNCIVPDECVRCTAPALFTELPGQRLQNPEVIMEMGGWGWVKSLVATFF